MSAPYEYSYRKEVRMGAGTVAERTQYRGRCSCGRQTHLSYSSPATALTAIRRVHNPDTEGETHDRNRQPADA